MRIAWSICGALLLASVACHVAGATSVATGLLFGALVVCGFLIAGGERQ